MRSESRMPSINAGVYIINLGVFVMLAGFFCFGAGDDPASIFVASLWLGSPYLGHCLLARASPRDGWASAVVLGLTLFNIALVLRFLVFPPPSLGSWDGHDDENGLGFVSLFLPVLQWILVVVVGIVLLLCSYFRPSGPPTKSTIPPLGGLD